MLQNVQVVNRGRESAENASQARDRIDAALRETEEYLPQNPVRLSHDEVFGTLRRRVDALL